MTCVLVPNRNGHVRAYEGQQSRKISKTIDLNLKNIVNSLEVLSKEDKLIVQRQGTRQ